MKKLAPIALTLATALGLLVVGQPAPAQAKTINLYGVFTPKMKLKHQVPKSVRGTWYAYNKKLKKNVKLTFTKTAVIETTKTHKRQTIKLAKKSFQAGRVDFRTVTHGWYRYQYYLPSTEDFKSGILRPATYKHNQALLWYPDVLGKHSLVVYTHAKQKHAIYRSAKPFTIVNFNPGK